MLNTISTSCAAPSPLVSTYSCTQSPAEVRITELEAEIARLRLSAQPSHHLSFLAYSRSAQPRRQIHPPSYLFAPRTPCLDRCVAPPSRAATFSPPDPRSTLPLAVAVPAFAHSAPRHSFSVPYSPRVVQQSATHQILHPQLVLRSFTLPPTFHAPRIVHSNIYFDAEHAQAAHSLSESPTRAALAPGDQKLVVLSSVHSAVHFTGYSTSIGVSAVEPAYTSIPASPFRSDTPPSSIRPFTSRSASSHFRQDLRNTSHRIRKAPGRSRHAQKPPVLRLRTQIVPLAVSTMSSQSRMCYTTPHSIHSAPLSILRRTCITPLPLTFPTSNLAPASSIIRASVDHTTVHVPQSRLAYPRTSETESTEFRIVPNNVPTRSPSLSASNASPVSIKSLHTASLFIPTSPPLPSSSPPRFSSYRIPPCFSRRRSRCATRLVGGHRSYSPRTSSFAAPRSPVDPLLAYTSRHLDASHAHP